MADERKIGAVQIDRLYDFLDGLQASGYTIDPRQYLALSDLLMVLIARGDVLDDLPLKTLIAPLICTTPAEQQDFYQRFDRWYPTLLPAKQESLSVEVTALPPPPKRKWSIPTINRKAVIWFTVIIVVTALIIWLFSNSAATGKPVINSTVSLYSVIFAVFSFTVWLGWRVSILYQENQYITRELANQEPVYTKVPVNAYIQDVMPVMKFKPIVSSLRKRTQVPCSVVDVDKTIENALNRNNWLEIVYRQQQVMPEYVVLIDRKSHLDQQARFVQEVLVKLSADGVWLHQYEFSGDPRICFPLNRKDTPLRLKDLHSRHPDTRLLIFSGTSELTNPLTGLLQEWLEFLSYWQERAILTSDIMQKVLLEELEAQDFAILPMTFDGLASLVRTFETDNAPLLTNNGTGMPAQLTERPMRWIGRDVPPEVEVKTLVEDVQSYLGEDGFYWFCATAVYPELRWELTLHLGNELKDDFGKSLLNPDLLIRLASLPWFRFGYMPDWIRLAIIQRFAPKQAINTRNTLSELLSTAFNGNGFDLAFSANSKDTFQTRSRKFLKALFRNSKQESIYSDYIFAKFILDNKSRKLSVQLPQSLREIISSRNILPALLSYVKGLFNFKQNIQRFVKAVSVWQGKFFAFQKLKTSDQKLIDFKLKVFIVYARQDQAIVLNFYEKLKNYPWIDTWLDLVNLRGGHVWDYKINEALRSSDVIIICLSKMLVFKEGYVQREVHRALDINLEKPEGATFIIPVILDDVLMPSRFKEFKSYNIFKGNEFGSLIQTLQERFNQLRQYGNLQSFPAEEGFELDLGRPLRVFLSGGNADRDAISGIYKRLIDDGFDVFSSVIHASYEDTDWRIKISKAIYKADVIIVCVSRSSHDREGYIQQETNEILDTRPADNQLFIIPVRLEECRVPESLSVFHWINYFDENGYSELVKSLRFRLAQLARLEFIKNQSVENSERKSDATLSENIIDSPINIRPLQVFLSCSNEDRASAREIHKILQSLGMKPWLDVEELLPGQNWGKEIERAIKRSDAAIYFLSKKRLNKERAPFEQKFLFERALDIPHGNTYLIPARLEECDIPYRLEGYHPADLFRPDGVQSLLNALAIRAEQLGLQPISSDISNLSAINDIQAETPPDSANWLQPVAEIDGDTTSSNIIIGDENNTNIKINFDPELLNYNELIDLPVDQFDEVQAFKLVRLFEIDLRRLITKEFNQRPGWWEKGIPVEVTKKLSKQQTESSNLLEFTALGDLFKIIQFKENWGIIFEPIFGDIRKFSQTMGVIVSGRNHIAHSSKMSQVEFRSFVEATNLALKQIRSYLSGETEVEQKKRLQEIKINLLEKDDIKTLGKAIREAEILIMRNMADEELLQLHQGGKAIWNQLHEENRLTNTVQVAILEDHPSTIESYLYRLKNESRITVVATANYGQDIEPILENHSIDLLIMDINHPISATDQNPSPSLAVITNLKKKYPNLEILVISMHSEVRLIESILDAGASGYINKADSEAIKKLVQIIFKIVDGGLYLSEDVYNRLRLSKSESGLLLSDRQIEVLSLCASYPDKSTSELAGMMGVSSSTFRNMLSLAYLRLEVHTRAAAISKAMKLGLIPVKLPDQDLADEIDKPKRLAKYTVGQQVKVKIARLVDFGAFAEIEPGLEGLIHVSKMTWGEVDDVSKFVRVGDVIDASVEKIDLEKQQIGLSMLKAEDDPFTKYKIGQRITGKIKKIIHAGLIVELESGVSGLVHISQISRDFITPEYLQEKFEINDSVNVLIIGVEADQRKLSLSIKLA